MSRIKLSVILVAIFSMIQVPTASADQIKVETTSKVTSNIPYAGDIWTGNIPSKVSYPSDSYSEKLEFPITGILPIDVLADRANGVEVDFAIWSESGVKLGSQTVYSFSWNPVGPNTMVSMYLSKADNLFGTHTMLITTRYTTSTTGLLSRYLKDEKKHTIEIVKVLPRKIPDTPVARGKWQGGAWEVEFDLIEANPAVSKYVLTLASLKSPSLSPTSTSNYNNRSIVLSGMGEKFSLTKSDVERYLRGGDAISGTPVVLVRVEAMNEVGYSTLSPGVYLNLKEFGLGPAPKFTRWITCVKGKVIKKFSGANPQCPTGYKVKK